MTQNRGTWPKEIVVCLECGEQPVLSMGCQGGFEEPRHPATQTVPVLPASIAGELVAALGGAEHELNRIADIVCAEDVDLIEERLSGIRTALDRFHAALGEEAADDHN